MVLRTVFSACAIVLGAVLIATWALSQAAVRAVEDGTAVVAVTSAALDSPAVLVSVEDALSGVVVDAIADSGVDVEALGLDGAIREQMRAVVQSDAFSTEVERQVALSQEEMAAALTDDERPSGPLVLDIDVSPLVNERIDDVAVVGTLVPDLDLAPVPVVVASADVVDDARTAFGWMEFAATWFLWIGVALVVFGFVVSARKRWFLAKTLLAVGVIMLGVWAVLTTVTPEAIVGWMPGAGDGEAVTIVFQTLSAESMPTVAQRMWRWGLVAIASSAVIFLVSAGMRRKRA